MSNFRMSRTMGQSNNKMITTTEARISQAVNNLDILSKSGKTAVNGLMDIFRHIDNDMLTLKSEKEFLARQLRRIETKTYRHLGYNDRMVVCNEADTQTEIDEEISLSTSNEALSSRNKNLEAENATLKEHIKLETTQASGQYQKKDEAIIGFIQMKRKLEITEKQLQEMQLANEKLVLQNNELSNITDSLQKNLSDLQKSTTEKETKVKNLEKKLSQLDMQYKIRARSIEQKKANLGEVLLKQIQDKELELTTFKEETDAIVTKMTNDISLGEVLFQNANIKCEDLEKKVLQFEDQISNLQITNDKLKTDFEIKETTATQENVTLQERITELSNNYASLLEKYEAFNQEKETPNLKTRMKKHLSFHSVLRQPQSDQAVSGIVSLLQAEMPNSHLEITQELERTGDNPLLVVLYNLSNLITEAKTALSGIEAAPNVALVVLHSKAVKKPSKHLLTEPEFKKLGTIVDLSFLTAKGIISNKLTDDAIPQLVEFINRF